MRSPLSQTGTALTSPRDGSRGRAQFCPQAIIESVSLKGYMHVRFSYFRIHAVDFVQEFKWMGWSTRGLTARRRDAEFSWHA